MKRQKHSLSTLLAACRKGKRSSQKQLYQQFYNYVMTLCLHYAKNQEEAQEICNDAFVKLFTKIHLYKTNIPFKTWLRRVVINTAIDYHRTWHLRQPEIDHQELPEQSGGSNEGWERLTHDDVMKMVQLLSPSYRLVFNLHVIEGFSHREIAAALGISEGTSKSNLSKAKAKLRTMLKDIE